MRWSSNSWFLQKFSVQLYDLRAAFKAARIMCPACGSAVDATCGGHRVASPHLPLLEQRQDDRWFDCRAAGLYRCHVGRDGNHWREDSEVMVPTCGVSSTLVSGSEEGSILVRPSSVATERKFSLLSAAFSDQQDSALADYFQASVLLQYNKRWCWLSVYYLYSS